MTYGCGSHTCVSCYPFQYACDYCAVQFPAPVANGDVYVCPECDWATNEGKNL